MKTKRIKQVLTFILYIASYIRITIKSIFWERFVKDIRIMLLTIGFPASGSSLLGFMLTAHPNIVVADEPKVTQEIDVDHEIKIHDTRYPNVDILYESDDLNKVFNYILWVDYQRLQNKNIIKSDSVWDRSSRYIVIPNQYQGCFKKLEVIGVKRSYWNMRILSNSNLLLSLKNKLEKRKIKLKFIFTVRNPYDMVTTACRPRYDKLDQQIQEYTLLCDKNMKLLQQIDPKDIFICRHEDTLKDPSWQLAKLCDFLQVPISPNYLDDCVSQVVHEPHKSRLKADWSEEQKQKVASLIEKYDFLSGYDWES